MQTEMQIMKHKQHFLTHFINKFFFMKQFFVLAFAAAAMVGCNENENSGNDSKVDLSQAQQLKVLTSVSNTRTAVDGTVLPVGSAIGGMVTDEVGTADFTAVITLAAATSVSPTTLARTAGFRSTRRTRPNCFFSQPTRRVRFSATIPIPMMPTSWVSAMLRRSPSRS